jgi:hypothetical protein
MLSYGPEPGVSTSDCYRATLLAIAALCAGNNWRGLNEALPFGKWQQGELPLSGNRLLPSFDRRRPFGP